MIQPDGPAFGGYSEDGYSEHQWELIAEYRSLRAPAVLLWTARQELQLIDGQDQEEALSFTREAFQALTSQMDATRAKLEADGIVVGAEPWATSN
jgi:hypothetical protein